MDTLRGCAIILVILQHATALAAMLSGVGAPTGIAVINAAALPYRMPLLMMLSGMLLGHSLAKPQIPYFMGKVRSIVWPYLVWVLVYALIVGFDTFTSWDSWFATSWLWYLSFLAAYYVAAPLLRPVASWVPPLVFWLASFVVPAPELTLFFMHAGFFFAGHALWSNRVRLRRFDNVAVMLVCVAVSVAYAMGHVMEALGRSLPVTLSRDDLTLLPVLLVSLFGLIFIARTLPRRWTAPIRFVGRNSIVFYVTHFPLQIVITTWLANALLWEWWLHLGLVVVVPLIVGIILVRLRRWPPCDALFVMPLPARWRERLRASGQRALRR